MSREEKLRTIISTIDNSKYSATKKTTNNKCMMRTFKEANDTWLAEAYSKKKYADYKPFQFVDGEGVRCSIYLSGCLFACKECFNEVHFVFGGIVYRFITNRFPYTISR